MLGGAPGDDRLDAALPDEAPVLVVVIAAIGDHLFGAVAWAPAPAANRLDRVDQRQQLGDVVAVGAG